jgi:hypothetical protein
VLVKVGRTAGDAGQADTDEAGQANAGAFADDVGDGRGGSPTVANLNLNAVRIRFPRLDFGRTWQMASSFILRGGFMCCLVGKSLSPR